MTIHEIYRQYLQELADMYGMDESAAITGLVFEKFAGMKRPDILMNPKKIPGQEVARALQKALSSLKKHVPVQHITGEAWFNNMLFKVSKDTLIPRPETEELTAMAILNLKNNGKPVVIDIGTGSGCIAISIKKRYPLAEVIAVDVSEAALEIAKENARKHKTDIRFIHLDFLKKKNWALLPQAQLIISNPPYIPFHEKKKLDKHVAEHEPKKALFVPSDNPLVFYKKIADFGKTHLEPVGQIMMETHESMAKDVAAIFKIPKYLSSVHKDMFGKKRFVTATHCLIL